MSDAVHLRRRDLFLIESARARVLLLAVARSSGGERTDVLDRLVADQPRLAAARDRLRRYAAVDSRRPRGTSALRRGTRAARRWCTRTPLRRAAGTPTQHARSVISRGYAIALRSKALIERSRALIELT